MKEQFIRNAQTQFLRDTVEFYNSGNRGTSLTGHVCVYEPVGDSPGCAIGRHIPNKELCRNLHGGVRDLEGKAWAFGPLLVLDVGFLRDVQLLHDQRGNWNRSGLSEYGESVVTDICHKFGLDTVSVLPTSGVTNR